MTPAAATKHTAAGAKAFAVFFIKTIDWGYATTSGSYLRHYSLAGCATCKSLAAGFQKARRAHHHYIGGRISIVRAAPLGGTSLSQVVTVNISSFEEVDKHNRYVQADGAHKGLRFRVDVEWPSSAWRIREVSVVR